MKLAINPENNIKSIKPEVTIDSFDKAKKVIKFFPVLGAKKMNHDSEIGEPIIFQVVLDISGSTIKLHNELVNCFNKILIPVLAQHKLCNKTCIRLGCMLLSDKLIPVWRGFKNLEELKKHPLALEDLDQVGPGCRTALYGAMRTSIFLTAATMEHMYEEGYGEMPKGKILILTDGINTRPPKSISIVKKVFENVGRTKRGLRTYILNLNPGDESAKSSGFESAGFDKETSLANHLRSFLRK